MTKHQLFPESDLAPGGMREVTVGATSFVIMRTQQGDLHALRNRCPHMGAKLSEGFFKQKIVADEVGCPRIDDREYVAICPWHGFEFSAETGECSADPRTRIRSYKVTVEDDMIVLDR